LPRAARASVRETRAPPHAARASVRKTRAPPHAAQASVRETHALPRAARASVRETRALPRAVRASVRETRAPPRAVGASVRETRAPPRPVRASVRETHASGGGDGNSSRPAPGTFCGPVPARGQQARLPETSPPARGLPPSRPRSDLGVLKHPQLRPVRLDSAPRPGPCPKPGKAGPGASRNIGAEIFQGVVPVGFRTERRYPPQNWHSPRGKSRGERTEEREEFSCGMSGTRERMRLRASGVFLGGQPIL
ncbi:MAG: hypothetical protein RLZZ253_2914, partial [Verrucomicrobiota bacterium]